MENEPLSHYEICKSQHREKNDSASTSRSAREEIQIHPINQILLNFYECALHIAI